MSAFVESLRVLFGADPARPDKSKFPEEVKKLHAQKKFDPERIAAIHKELAEAEKGPQKWRRRRWAVLITINLLFVLSYWLDISLLEGALTASRFVGFHMADLNSALQVMLAYKHIVLNLVIGTTTVFIMWWLLGGRTFCSWVCPYHLVAEWAESIHLKLVEKGWAKDHPFDRRTRTWHFKPRPDLRAGTRTVVGGPVAAVRNFLFTARLVSLWLPDWFNLRAGWFDFAFQGAISPQGLFARRRMPQGLHGAACA